MKLTKINLSNIKTYISQEVELCPGINVFIGKNNSGKSAVIRTPLFIQHNTGINIAGYRRKGADSGIITLSFKESIYAPTMSIAEKVQITLTRNEIQLKQSIGGSSWSAFNQLNSIDDHTIFVPLLSTRTKADIATEVNLSVEKGVPGNISNLSSKIDRLNSFRQRREFQLFENICNEVFGTPIYSLPIENGKMPGIETENGEIIDIREMGQGVIQLLALMCDCLTKSNKIFIIEELENDLHPDAVRVICDIIVQSSEKNQFLLSTHSATALKRIVDSAPDTAVYQARISDFQATPITTLSRIDARSHDYFDAIGNLGYTLSDHGLYDYIFIFEEPSFEIIFNELLLPTVDEDVRSKIKTISASGKNKAGDRLRRINDLFVTPHLLNAYKNKCYVIIDGGKSEFDIIKQMRTIYKKHGWKEDCFDNLSTDDLEDVYPESLKTEYLSAIKDVLDYKILGQMKIKYARKYALWARDRKDENQKFRKVLDILRRLK